jgi:hypothetical protein
MIGKADRLWGPRHAAFYGENGMNLSYVHKLLLAADPFSAIRTNFRGWRKKFPGRVGKKKQRKLLRGRHLTVAQREDISTDLQGSMTGAVSMTAAASDREAVCYEGEIANVLEDTGFKVEIDNAERKPPEHEIPTGVEMTVADKTIRPSHAYWIVRAFRQAGVAIATRINTRRQKNNTLYITVGPNGLPALVPPTIRTAATWQSKSLATVLEKWKMKFARGLQWPKRGS